MVSPVVTSLLIVSLILGNEGRGELPTAASVEERERPRVRMSVGLGGMLGIAQFGYIAPVLRLEAGVMMNDRLGLSATADLSSRLDSHSLGGGLALSWAGLEWLTLSAGLALVHMGAIGRYDYAAAQLLVVPLRAELVFLVRSPQSVRRASPVLSLMIAPGVSRLAQAVGWSPGRVGEISGAVLVGVTLAYAVW